MHMLPATDAGKPQAAELRNGELFSTVVAGGYCVGCGACAAATAKIEMQFTALGTYQAAVKNAQQLSRDEERRAAAVCPFSAQANNEDEIAAPLYEGHCKPHPEVGFYAETHAGYVIEGDFRARGSSGGMGTWLVAELLRLGLIDAVLHVTATNEPAPGRRLLFRFSISRSLDELSDGAKSRYYPVTLAHVLEQVRAQPTLRYALVGVPCFVKAVRLLARQDAVFGTAIRFYVGLVCGHLKSAAFGELLGWQVGVPPEGLTGINFREKLEGRKASRYGFRAETQRADPTVNLTRPVSEVFGADWGLGLFKYKACDFCDDVFAETADITVGDAWLPQYDGDFRGTNVLVVRHAVFSDLLARAVQEGRIKLAALSIEETARSQRSGLRHRREGLRWRLITARRRGEWHPPKRPVVATCAADAKRNRLYEVREELRELSHQAFRKARANGNLEEFLRDMRPALKRYSRAYQPQLSVRIKNRLRRVLAYLNR